MRIEDLSPTDLPGLIKADRQRAEEKHLKRRERANFAREARAGLERIRILQPAEQQMLSAKKEVA